MESAAFLFVAYASTNYATACPLNKGKLSLKTFDNDVTH
jgi:hypothetical protein